MSYNGIIKAFSKIGLRYFGGTLRSSLKEALGKTGTNILFEIYVGRMFFFSFLAFVLPISIIPPVLHFIFNYELLFSFVTGLLVGCMAFSLTLAVHYLYPIQKVSSRKNSLEANMTFALNHMSAIASSGVPPFVVFKLLTNVKEYGEVMEEAKRITRNVEVFGMDLLSAIKNVAERTPSEEFRQFLYGITSTVETGGDLKSYLENSASNALFEYRLKRQRYLQILSTYADFYTAVLIAAPLFFVSVLAVMALIGGDIFGMPITVAMRLGVFIFMPLMNIIFLMFVHYTQPKG